MPKARRGEILRPRQEVKKRPISEEEINTDISKSLNENIENRFRHWEKIEKETKEMEQKLEQLKKEYRECPDIPENRPKISNLRAEIRDMEEKIQRINRSKDPTEYLFCVANVIRFEREIEKEEHSGSSSNGNKKETIKVNAAGPLKPRIKKKKLANNQASDANIFYGKPITSYFPCSTSDKSKSAKKLAQYLHEIPLDPIEYEYCPTCITELMQYQEKPPSLYCKKCGLSIDEIDNTSAAVHDKDTATHVPFTYRPKLHFISWVKRITGKLRFSIPSWVIDAILLKLWKQHVTDVNDVTWDKVDNILRSLASNNKAFSDYYPHVYQITNIIRGKAILSFTEEEEQEIFEYFDPIFLLWESKKHLFLSERSNFMYNALVLQIIFMILKYPPSVIKIFNNLKGDSNLRFYDNIIKMICEELGQETFCTSEFDVMKCGKKKNIIEELKTRFKDYYFDSSQGNTEYRNTNCIGTVLPPGVESKESKSLHLPPGVEIKQVTCGEEARNSEKFYECSVLLD